MSKNGFLALVLLILTANSQAHPGRTAADGCHYCRTNCEAWGVPAGQRHCHNSPVVEDPELATKVHSMAVLEVVKVPDYDRDDWNHWIDEDRDCQNLRQELLIEQSLIAVTFTDRKDGKDCTVLNGEWRGPYTSNVYSKASDLDIDHVVPLNWAHLHGGWEWNKEQKEAFANDRENLLVVDDGENQSKSAQGPDTWLPPLTSYHCEYIQHFDKIVVKYELRYTATEADFLWQYRECLSDKTLLSDAFAQKRAMNAISSGARPALP